MQLKALRSLLLQKILSEASVLRFVLRLTMPAEQIEIRKITTNITTKLMRTDIFLFLKYYHYLLIIYKPIKKYWHFWVRFEENKQPYTKKIYD